jgi:hypothetical protein
MTETDSRPGEGHRGDIDDQSRAGEVSSSEGSRIQLPPNPGKVTDSRATGFVARRGELVQVEIDALPPETLRALFAGAITDYWDGSAYAAVLEREDAERALLRTAAAVIREQRSVTRDVSALDYDELRLLAEVHKLTGEVIKLAGGSVPPVGSAAWWSAPDAAKVAGLLVLAESRLLDDPHQLAAEQLREVSIAISGAMDWRRFADRHISRTELQRRRDQLGPLYQPYAGGPVAWDTSNPDAK